MHWISNQCLIMLIRKIENKIYCEKKKFWKISIFDNESYLINKFEKKFFYKKSLITQLIQIDF